MPRPQPFGTGLESVAIEQPDLGGQRLRPSVEPVDVIVLIVKEVADFLVRLCLQRGRVAAYGIVERGEAFQCGVIGMTKRQEGMGEDPVYSTPRS